MRLFITFLFIACSAFAADLPTPSVTPGATLPVTLDHLCHGVIDPKTGKHIGYTKSVRNVPAAVKARAYERYGIKSHKPGQFEVDHLISLELGGSNDIKNLWPQSYAGHWNAHLKDSLENELHARVCAGTMTLDEAQRGIAKDWIALYKRVMP